MTVRRRLIELDDAQAGMVLAEAVVDPCGSVLLQDATPLTAPTLASLRRRGIDSIYVIDDSVPEADELAARERTAKRIAHLFRKCPDQGACAILLRWVKEYREGNPR